jgi:hypothetical protein
MVQLDEDLMFELIREFNSPNGINVVHTQKYLCDAKPFMYGRIEGVAA